MSVERFDEPVDVGKVVRRAHRRLGRRALATLVGGLVVSALLGLGGEGVRRAVHPEPAPTPTTDRPQPAPTAPVTVPPTSAVVVPVVEEVRASASKEAVAVSWRRSPYDGVVGYLVYRDGRRLVRVDDADIADYNDTDVVPAATYTYVVRAVDAEGRRSAPSQPATATVPEAEPPTTPTGVEVDILRRPDGTYATHVLWKPSTDNIGVAGYEIRREGKVVGTVDGDTTTYTDRGAHFDEDYTVVAFDAAGNRSKESRPAFEPGVD